MGYVVLRAAVGALLNPAYNGPDESGHVEYVRTLIESGGRNITGVEARQPATYYVLAAVPWQLTAGQPDVARLFWTRLVSALAGAATLALTWQAARVCWPERRVLAALAAVALLAPGHFFLLASVSNDPPAAALASLGVLAAVRLWVDTRPAPRWWLVWAAACLAAVATKPTTLPVALGTGVALGFRARRELWRHAWVRVAAVGLLLVVVGTQLALLAVEPTGSAPSAVAQFWPRALVRAPVAYVARGGLAESFRTWWYAYDYLVRWPRVLDVVLGLAAMAVTLVTVYGLVLRGPLRLPPWSGRAPAGERAGVPAVLWFAALAQALFVLGRFGFGDVLKIEMGGAAQAKVFFPALAPLALLFAAGVSAAGRSVGVADRWTAVGAFGFLLVLDVASLALTTWQHYRWWAAGT